MKPRGLTLEIEELEDRIAPNIIIGPDEGEDDDDDNPEDEDDDHPEDDDDGDDD